MIDKTKIRTTKTIYPQIYAYTLPTIPEKNGWIKIGYTERKSVDDRINEQTNTAALRLSYDKLWSGPAKYHDKDEWFKDHQLHTYLERFKHIERQRHTEWFFYNGNPERSQSDFEDFRNQDLNQVKETITYQLREEQEQAVQRTLEYARHNPGGKFLWNAKPRFGKTLATYDLARKLEANNILVITNRPAIANSWFDDFEKFIAWQTDYQFVSTTDSLRDRQTLSREEYVRKSLDNNSGSLPQIVFLSLQDLKGSIYFGGKFDKLEWVKLLNWDLLVIDEAHEGIDTIKTDVAFEKIKRQFTLHLSGTPFKQVASGQFHENQIFNWTYADEQAAKKSWDRASESNNPYDSLPRLNLFTYQMSQMITEQVNQGANIDGKDMDYAFDLNEFFATNESGKFIHEDDINKWLDTLTRNEKYPFSTKELRDQLKHTFWLLNRVASAKALEKLLKKHPVFENYTIILAAGDGISSEDDQVQNAKALNRVRKAIEESERTITLSVGQLTTGITVPEWSGVLMLSNIKSPALYMQAAFRAQSPWTYVEQGERKQKDNAYVFDFAPERTLIMYDEFANNLSKQTVNGGGTTQDRQDNIQTLLNFFPVIGEDTLGRMVELDVTQVLTIPRYIKAREVVSRGFMSNLLFQNISGIFASEGAREILEKLNPVDKGKSTPRQTEEPINTQGVAVDNNGNIEIDPDIVISKTQAHFGEKVFENVMRSTQIAVIKQDKDIKKIVVDQMKASLTTGITEVAKEQGISQKTAENILKQQTNILAREIEKIQSNTEIDKKVLQQKLEADKKLYDGNAEKIKEIIKDYEIASKTIVDSFNQEIIKRVKEVTPQIVKQSTEDVITKAEEKKKTTVEDDVRARLRGFTRTIPSFLMAYGQKDTNLANFDQTLKDSVFQEVTGITLDQFRMLRDNYNFFDPIVFDESVQEFLRKKQALSNYFDENNKEDIFDYIPPQQTNQIFTPKKVVKMMVDNLEEENPGIFSDSTKKFADLYMKSGLFITEIVTRLYKGLENEIVDPDERIKHIMENQVFGFAPTEIIYNIASNFVFGFDEKAGKINDSHIVHLDTTPFAQGQGDFEAKCDELLNENNVLNKGVRQIKFDVVIGNPPYQEEINGANTQSRPIYHLFMDLAHKLSEKSLLITPARFLANTGGTPKKWNLQKLADKHFCILFYEIKSNIVFPNTDIKGGVAVTYYDKNKEFEPIETFIPDPLLNNIYRKVKLIGYQSMSEIIFGSDSYRFSEEMFNENPNLMDRTDRAHRYAVSTNVFDRYPEIFVDNEPDYPSLQIFGRDKNQRVSKYIKNSYLRDHPNLHFWKVLVPKANGSGALGEALSTPLIGAPLIGHTQTYISVGKFAEYFEADACYKYIRTKFARTMLGILKLTQDNPPSTWAKVPLQNFKENSDIDWSQSIPNIDQQLYNKYGLSQEEIDFIEEKVQAMD